MKPRRRISEFESDSIAMAQVQLGTVVCLCQVRCEYRSILLPVMTRLMRSNRCFSLDFMSRVASSSIIMNLLPVVPQTLHSAWVSYKSLSPALSFSSLLFNLDETCPSTPG